MSAPRHNLNLPHSISYLEELYELYCRAPASLSPEWQRFFKDFASPAAHAETAAPRDSTAGRGDHDSARVEAMVNHFRRRGHLYARYNPLRKYSEYKPHLDLHKYELDAVDASQVFYPADLEGVEAATLAEIVERLDRSYCGAIGVDFMEINNEERVVWIGRRIEQNLGRPAFNRTQQLQILRKLIAAEAFERFLHTRYLGQKRFSLEGCDVLIPMLDFLLAQSAESAIAEICIGMAHRGRLNVLANFMQKQLEHIFTEFEGSIDYSFDIDGDVKYHLGFDAQVSVGEHKVDLCLLPNPSHLEAVNPVLEGYVYGRQRARGAAQVLPILMHGDASFSGQGVVFETLNLSKLDAYHTGGTIHIIINNQIGFTTDQQYARSTDYCSDIVKAIRAPVFHVNADDPEAAVWTAQLALAYRQQFARDVVIDIVGYRRHGHNEGDEPAFTQPLMYQQIAAQPRVLETYSQYLCDNKAISAEELDAEKNAYKTKLEEAHKQVKKPAPTTSVQPRRKKNAPQVDTAVSRATIKAVLQKITTPPPDFNLHSKIARIFEQRRTMGEAQGKIDWATAELLAMATLASEGRHVRLSGQDCQRGTFSSRHAVAVDTKDGTCWSAFSAYNDLVAVINSPLSEFGALGFEFGYSIVDKQALIMWEAQFGDFVNGAQIIIDQFIVASEAKWRQCSALVMLLPHGYEGMGPEHSNARPERFLQLCGNGNIQVAVPTTAAQYFHLLRRQALRDWQKPLVIMSPKSLLRHPQVSCAPETFTDGHSFQEVIADVEADAAQVTRVIVCSGKIFYELAAQREKLKLTNVALLRFEQLYPFPEKTFVQIMTSYPDAKELFWVQEEPQNMGAWSFMRPRLRACMPNFKLRYIGRKTSGTTAEGYMKAHTIAQQRIITEAFSFSAAGHS